MTAHINNQTYPSTAAKNEENLNDVLTNPYYKNLNRTYADKVNSIISSFNDFEAFLKSQDSLPPYYLIRKGGEITHVKTSDYVATAKAKSYYLEIKSAILESIQYNFKKTHEEALLAAKKLQAISKNPSIEKCNSFKNRMFRSYINAKNILDDSISKADSIAKRNAKDLEKLKKSKFLSGNYPEKIEERRLDKKAFKSSLEFVKSQVKVIENIEKVITNHLTKLESNSKTIWQHEWIFHILTHATGELLIHHTKG